MGIKGVGKEENVRQEKWKGNWKSEPNPLERSKRKEGGLP